MNVRKKEFPLATIERTVATYPPPGEPGSPVELKEREAIASLVDPFGSDSSIPASRGLRFDYPATEGVAVEPVLVTHEHFDHDGVEAVGGSPVGEVVAVASEHDEVAGTPAGRTRSSASRPRACGCAISATSARPRFARRSARLERLDTSELVVEELIGSAGRPVVALPAAPLS